MPAIRPAAVAGKFYPGARAQLAADVRALLGALGASGERSQPKALIVPHAGYVYSGSIAARAYARLLPGRESIRRVVLLGPAHHVALRGLALPAEDAFETPLGRVPVDREALARLRTLPQVSENPAAHASEHSLEVQLPFLQSVLESFSIVPLVVGNASPEEVEAALELVWGGAETLIVVSSDLSHYQPYDVARERDRLTIAAVLALEGTLDREQACGSAPINGFVRCAKKHALAPELLDLRNSGDIAGDKSRVVGYGAISFAKDDVLGKTLLATARRAIESRLGRAGDDWPDHAALAQPGATFVTLQRNGALRGCIGTLQAHRALGLDVRENAVAAAFRDPRFPALLASELAGLEVEVSLLSKPERLAVADEAQLIRVLRPGIDGVILDCEGKRATFLPQVWSMLPQPREFLARLRLKAGLPATSWSPALRVYRYGVEKWGEARA